MYQCRLSIALAHRQLADGVSQGCIYTRPGCKAACLLLSQHHQETALQPRDTQDSLLLHRIPAFLPVLWSGADVMSKG